MQMLTKGIDPLTQFELQLASPCLGLPNLTTALLHRVSVTEAAERQSLAPTRLYELISFRYIFYNVYNHHLLHIERNRTRVGNAAHPHVAAASTSSAVSHTCTESHDL